MEEEAYSWSGTELAAAAGVAGPAWALELTVDILLLYESVVKLLVVTVMFFPLRLTPCSVRNMVVVVQLRKMLAYLEGFRLLPLAALGGSRCKMQLQQSTRLLD